MKKRFNTKETAEKHLEYRRKCAVKRIEKSGDIILGDNSFVMYHENENKWSVMLMIVTKKMRKELINRWEKSGLLEGLNGNVDEKLTELFKSELSYLINEKDDINNTKSE